MVATIIVIVIVVLLIALYAGLYNGLVQLRTHAQESWSQIDVQLQRRNDLIPNLVSTVKGYSKYEANTLEKVTQLRSQLENIPDDDRAQKMAVSNELTGTLRSLFAVAENYPDLKSSTTTQLWPILMLRFNLSQVTLWQRFTTSSKWITCKYQKNQKKSQRFHLMTR